MKNQLLLLMALCLLLVVQTAFAQPICGFDGIHKKMLKDPSNRKALETSEASLRRYIDAHKNQLGARVNGTMATLYNIPVVVHVIHTGGAIGSIYNPTDAQILDAVAYLNEVYNGTFTGTTGVGDLQIQFVMAQRDPNCNSTNGINRIDGSGLAGYVTNGVNRDNTGGATDLDVKNLIRWPNTDYYNIWIVNKIDGADGTAGQFYAGYAQLGQFASSNPLTDGTVMLATQMKRNQKTLPHEIGHAFSLYHTFEGSNDATECPANTTCSVDGDQICDTDPVSFNKTGTIVDFTCRTGLNNTCTGTPYNTNTEENYMAYTNCYHLFTAGQKARMLASAASPGRIGLSTSLGGTPTYSASNPCTPKINFELTDTAPVTEVTAATSGCRSYKDYTFNMVIGNNPSVAATATLNIASGTATETVDYDITTNGDFSSPSKIISFPTGSHAPQPFTIRIYDDAIVESTETCTLGFTINSGGGNAVKGDGRINLTFSIVDNDVSPSGPFNVTKSIGTSVGQTRSPFVGSLAKQKTQLIYKAYELTAAGIPAGYNIVGLAMNIVKNSGVSFVYQGLTIKIGQTTDTTLYTPGKEFPLNDATFTTVYSNNYTTVNGLNNFNFSTPFVWNGTSNVVVEVCYDNGATPTGADDNCLVYVDNIVENSNYVYATINCATNYSSFGFITPGFKPIIQLIYTDPGTQPQTVLNTSRQEYLGPNADVCFYDQSTGKILARINNSTSFDYGCTQVVIDRNDVSAGANTVAFWNNTPANYLMSRTLKVIPATNNPSGSYQMSLYYTQAEINAWQTATGQTVSNIEMVKVGTQISDVTPANPSGAGAIVKKIPTISSLGTNTVLTASFTTGFSGFGAGITGNAALPVLLLDFTGSLRSNSVVLNWSTSSEINSSYFDVERSYDGSAFAKAGTVTAAGFSSIVRNYTSTDPFAREHNYYRLKQVDADGKFVYSKVIQIDNKNYSSNFRIINNPFTDVLEIDFGKVQSGKTDIRLLDVTGKEIYHAAEDAAGQTRLQLNLGGRNISAGIYLLQVTTKNAQYTERVMKK